MIEKNFIHKIGELEEAAGILQQIEEDGDSALVRLSYRWYEVPNSLAAKLREAQPGQRVAILRLDDSYYFRMEEKCHD